LLEHLGLPSDRIDDGAKIDHYDIWRRRVRLRTESSVSSSVAALAIAAHEVGHAAQFATGYWAARATRCLLVLLLLGGAVLFVYPFVVIIAGDGEVNLTRLTAGLVIFPMLRLPLTLALERDASRRAVQLLHETRLADASEHAGIDGLLAACFRTHLAFSVGLVFLVSACVGAMSLVENSLDRPLPHNLLVALSDEFDPSGPQSPLIPIGLDESVMGNPLTLGMIAFSLGVAWWAMRGPTKKSPARTAIDANNEGMARFLANDPAGAIVMIDEALRLDPCLATAHYNRAVIH
jgi:Zn-dependent membrane protease YugP